jgi:hypothetical protein
MEWFLEDRAELSAISPSSTARLFLFLLPDLFLPFGRDVTISWSSSEIIMASDGEFVRSMISEPFRAAAVIEIVELNLNPYSLGS